MARCHLSHLISVNLNNYSPDKINLFFCNDAYSVGVKRHFHNSQSRQLWRKKFLTICPRTMLFKLPDTSLETLFPLSARWSTPPWLLSTTAACHSTSTTASICCLEIAPARGSLPFSPVLWSQVCVIEDLIIILSTNKMLGNATCIIFITMQSAGDLFSNKLQTLTWTSDCQSKSAAKWAAEYFKDFWEKMTVKYVFGREPRSQSYEEFTA